MRQRAVSVDARIWFTGWLNNRTNGGTICTDVRQGLLATAHSQATASTDRSLPGPSCRVTSRVSRPIVSCQAPGEQQMSASGARLKHFGWGREGEGLSADEEAIVLARAEARFGTALTESASAPRLDEIALAAPTLAVPGSLPFCTSGHYDRAAHTYGKSYPELARGLARDYASAPDVVAYPRNEGDVAAVLD